MTRRLYKDQPTLEAWTNRIVEEIERKALGNFYESIHGEVAELDNDDVVHAASKLLGIDESEVAEKLAELDIDSALNLVDAIAQGDDARVFMTLGFSHTSRIEDAEDDETDIESDNEGRDVEAPGEDEEVEEPVDQPEDDEPPVEAREPVEPEGPKEAPKGPEGEKPRVRESHYSLGDEVSVDGKEGYVKMPDGPHGSIGVLINGVLKMVEKKNVKRVDENAVLGMTNMPGLRRMLELAGLSPKDDEESAQADADQNNAPVEKAVEVVQTGPMALPGADVTPEDDDDADDAANDEGDDEVDQDFECDDEDGDGQCDAQQGLAPFSQGNEATNADPKAEVMAALEKIEANIRELKVGDFKAVNDRLTKIQGSLFEGMVTGRRRL